MPKTKQFPPMPVFSGTKEEWPRFKEPKPSEAEVAVKAVAAAMPPGTPLLVRDNREVFDQLRNQLHAGLVLDGGEEKLKSFLTQTLAQSEVWFDDKGQLKASWSAKHSQGLVWMPAFTAIANNC